MSTSIHAGGQVTIDPSDLRVIQFNWDDTDVLAASVAITTSTWTITTVKQGGLTILTKDQESIVSGNRKTQVRLIGTTATAGDKYVVANKIVTNESPAQTIEQSFKVLVENR